MAKSKVIAVTAEMVEGGLSVTFLRYDEAELRAGGIADWYQVHPAVRSEFSCKRVERILNAAPHVIVWPDRLAVTVDTDDEYWERQAVAMQGLLDDERRRMWAEVQFLRMRLAEADGREMFYQLHFGRERFSADVYSCIVTAGDGWDAYNATEDAWYRNVPNESEARRLAGFK